MSREHSDGHCLGERRMLESPQTRSEFYLRLPLTLEYQVPRALLLMGLIGQPGRSSNIRGASMHANTGRNLKS